MTSQVLSHTHQEVGHNKEVLGVFHRGRSFSDGGERQRGPVHAVGILPHQTTKLRICRVRVHEPVSTKTWRDRTNRHIMTLRVSKVQVLYVQREERST